MRYAKELANDLHGVLRGDGRSEVELTRTGDIVKQAVGQLAKRGLQVTYGAQGKPALEEAT